MTTSPLGVYPRTLHEESRMRDLMAAMLRFTRAGYEIPDEWVDEYADLAVSRYKRLGRF